MKILKAILAVLGVVGLVAAGIYLGFVWVDNERLLAAANANKSGNLFPSPMTNIYLAAALGSAGGLLLGLGIGLPMRTPGSVRRAALDEANRSRTNAIAAKAAGAGAGGSGGPGAAGGPAQPTGPQA
ncbi:MAG: hypothetical protein ACLGHZ_09685 [Actinomycetes bacterium]